MTRIPNNPVPERFVNLSASDLEAYPFISRVLAAYHDPSTHQCARFEGEIFLYPIVLPPTNRTVTDTNEFLLNRWGGRPYPVVLTPGNDTYYSWQVSIGDPGPIGPCR